MRDAVQIEEANT